MIYKVKLDIFEGPFDLLVYLIENAQMNIYDIQVSDITRQYIEHVEKIKRIDPILAGEFMVLAASLIEIKSKMLLPRKADEDSPEAFEDPRSELVQRILEYKKFKQGAKYLEECEERMGRIHTKPREDLSIYTKEADIFLNLDLQAFIKSFHLFIIKKKKLEDVHKRYTLVRQQQMTVESRIEQIKDLFMKKKTMKFNELLEGERTRQNVVLTFLSMLELIKQKTVGFRQNINCGEIIFTIDDRSLDYKEGEI